MEFNAKLPGDPTVGGLWPALWMLGNLARATYVGSSNYIWPYSYNRCDEKNRHSQKISACSKGGHYSLKEGRGRGSPEIDILEAMMGSDEKLPSTNVTRPYFSTSLQIAPGIDNNRPNLGKLPKKVSSSLSHILSKEYLNMPSNVQPLSTPVGILVRRPRIRQWHPTKPLLLRCHPRTQAQTIHLPIRCNFCQHPHWQGVL